MSSKCAVCGKTAYPLESVTALEATYHKSCFKCDVCKMTLGVKNFKGLNGKIYCATHTPVERSSTGADSLQTKTALAAPKKVAEGLGSAQKGTGETPNFGLDTVVTKNAMNAPKKVAEGLGTAQKGTGETPNVGLDTVVTKNAINAPKAKAEGLGTVQKGTADAPNYGLEAIGNQAAINAPKAAAEGLGTAHKGDARTAPQPVAGDDSQEGGYAEPAPAEDE
jgi:hypothetical protein